MNSPAENGINAFRARLENERADFLYMAPPQDSCAHIRFIGLFANQPVIWDAKIMTLAHADAVVEGSRHTPATQQFIDIDTEGNDIRGIRIGLSLERIDMPAILKTIIMIRKYKRLHTGYHAFNAT
jgi:hypothetical protein